MAESTSSARRRRSNGAAFIGGRSGPSCAATFDGRQDPFLWQAAVRSHAALASKDIDTSLANFWHRGNLPAAAACYGSLAGMPRPQLPSLSPPLPLTAAQRAMPTLRAAADHTLTIANGRHPRSSGGGFAAASAAVGGAATAVAAEASVTELQRSLQAVGMVDRMVPLNLDKEDEDVIVDGDDEDVIVDDEGNATLLSATACSAAERLAAAAGNRHMHSESSQASTDHDEGGGGSSINEAWGVGGIDDDISGGGLLFGGKGEEVNHNGDLFGDNGELFGNDGGLNGSEAEGDQMVTGADDLGSSGGGHKKKRRGKCGRCTACQIKVDCGQCRYCVHKRVLKQSCIKRKCCFLTHKDSLGRRSSRPLSSSGGVVGGGGVGGGGGSSGRGRLSHSLFGSAGRHLLEAGHSTVTPQRPFRTAKPCRPYSLPQPVPLPQQHLLLPPSPPAPAHPPAAMLASPELTLASPVASSPPDAYMTIVPYSVYVDVPLTRRATCSGVPERLARRLSSPLPTHDVQHVEPPAVDWSDVSFFAGESRQQMQPPSSSSSSLSPLPPPLPLLSPPLRPLLPPLSSGRKRPRKCSSPRPLRPRPCPMQVIKVDEMADEEKGVEEDDDVERDKDLVVALPSAPLPATEESCKVEDDRGEEQDEERDKERDEEWDETRDDGASSSVQLECTYIDARGNVRAPAMDDAECPHRMHVCLSPGRADGSCDGTDSPVGSSAFLITERPGDAADVDELLQDTGAAALDGTAAGDGCGSGNGMDTFVGELEHLRLLINVDDTSMGTGSDDEGDEYDVVLRLKDGTFSSCMARGGNSSGGSSMGSSCIGSSFIGTPSIAATVREEQQPVQAEPGECADSDAADARSNWLRPACRSPSLVFTSWPAVNAGSSHDSDDGPSESGPWGTLLGLCRQWANDDFGMAAADEVVLCDELGATEVLLSDEAEVTMLTTASPDCGSSEAEPDVHEEEVEEEEAGWLLQL